MYNFFAKNGQMIAFLTGTVVTVLFLIFVFAGLEGFNNLAEEARTTTSIFNFGIGASIALIIICAALMLIFGVWQIVTNLSGSVKGLIGIGVIAVIFAIAYISSPYESSGLLRELYYKYEISEGVAKFINAGILTSTVMAGLAALGIVVGELRNFFK